MRVNLYERRKQPASDIPPVDAPRALFDGERFPPPGTMCADCGCCRAGIFAGEGELRVAICLACDQGIVCAPQQRQLDALKDQPVRTQAEFDKLLASVVADRATPTPAERKPAEPSASAEPEAAKEIAMPKTCAGGCGTEIKTDSPWKYARGHKNGCPQGGATPKKRATRLPPPQHVIGHRRACDRS